MGEILTTDEAARFLKVEPQTMRRWRMRGDGPKYFRLGGLKGPARYKTAELLAWADGRSASSTTEESVRRAGAA